MKKDELIGTIEKIEPDIYIKERLKTKVTAELTQRAGPGRIMVKALCICLAVAVAFGVGFLALQKTPEVYEGTELVSENKTVPAKGFIMLASAKEAEESQVIPMGIEEEIPCQIYLKITEAETAEGEERRALHERISGEMEELLGEKAFSRARCSTCTQDNFVLTQCVLNEFRLAPEKKDNIKSITVKNSSEYGQVACAINSRPTFSVKYGHEITVAGEEIDIDKDGFYWDHTAEMDKALSEDRSISFTEFNDRIIFTVEYEDGTKAKAVVDLIFSEDGCASSICRSYEIIK